MTCNHSTSRPLPHPHGSEKQRTTCKRISAPPRKHKQFRRFSRRGTWLALLGAVLLGACSGPENGETVFFVVRHAEKQQTGEDPELDAAGRQRAAQLADLLADAGLTSVHSTNYRRTRETAQAVAERLGLDIALYDPAEPGELLDELLHTGGRHLLIGHSNTVPGMVAFLGGEPGGAIDEGREYDRLYVVTLDRQGSASTVLLRYGSPFVR